MTKQTPTPVPKKATAAKATKKVTASSSTSVAHGVTKSASGKTVKKAAARSSAARAATGAAGARRASSARYEPGSVRGPRPTAVTHIQQAVDRYRELLESADKTERARLIDAVTADAAGAGQLEESLWGPTPGEAEVRAAQLSQLRGRFDDRRALAERSLTRDAAAELLSISPQAVTEHLRHGDLTGLKEGKRWLLPAWQFDPDCARGFLPGIAEVAAAFPGGIVSLSRWVTRANPDFDDRAPRDEMAAGRASAVAAAAAALTAAGW